MGKPPSVGLYRFALLVEIAVLILIASGAFVTSAQEASASAAASTAASAPGATVHFALGIGVSVLVLILAVSVWIEERRASVRILGAVAVFAAAIDSWCGTGSSLSPAQAVVHASFVPVFFGSVAAIVMLMSPRWSLEPELVDDRGLRFLRPLAMSAPPLVLMQIVLGALYRHKITSVMWHMAGAMVVSLITLIASMVVIQQYATHKQLRGPGIHLMAVVLLQVALGVTAFTMQLLETENTVVLAVFTASHVLVGNMVLAASLVFAAQVRRNVGGVS